MKCDVVFSRLKRFKFEKIKKNEFRPTMAKLVERRLSLDFLFSAIAFDQFGHSRAKFVFLDFLEFKAFQAGKNNITFHIHLRAIPRRK